MKIKNEPEVATQYRVTVPNVPGMLARITSIFLKANVNINGMMTESLGDVAHVRLLADRDSGVAALLEKAGFPVIEVKVFKADVPNKPGGLNKLAKALAEDGVNILCVYGTAAGSRAKVIVAVDELEKAAPIIARWGSDGVKKGEKRQHD
jgi:hypothetical protein